MTGNARQFAKQTRSCSCKPHWGLHCLPSHFRKLKCDFWLAPLQPPQAALRPEMAALPHGISKGIILSGKLTTAIYAHPGRRGRRPPTAWQGILQIFSIETRQSPRRGQVTPPYCASWHHSPAPNISCTVCFPFSVRASSPPGRLAKPGRAVSTVSAGAVLK